MMPAIHDTDSKRIQMLIALARELASRHRRRAGSRAPGEDSINQLARELQAGEHPRFAGAPTTLQKLRELHHAYAVFGHRLEKLYLLYGSAKVNKLAKLPVAEQIVRTGEIPAKLTGGRPMSLKAATVKDLEGTIKRHTAALIAKTGPGRKGGPLFDLYGDLEAVADLLERRLKSLTSSDPALSLQFKIVRRNHRSFKPISRLKRLLTIFKALADIAMSPDTAVARSIIREVEKPARPSGVLRLQAGRPMKELIRRHQARSR